MGAITKNEEALNEANALISFVKNLIKDYENYAEFFAYNNQRGYSNTWDDLQTYTMNADGTQGTIDPSPVASHPIVGVNLSFNDLSALVGSMSTFKTNMETGTPTLIAQLRTRIARQ